MSGRDARKMPKITPPLSCNELTQLRMQRQQALSQNIISAIDHKKSLETTIIIKKKEEGQKVFSCYRKDFVLIRVENQLLSPSKEMESLQQ